MLGLTPARGAARATTSVIEFAELEEFDDLKLKNYSSGMHVRLAFSVMIQVDADVLLIDEVLAVGDAGFQQKCFEVFQRLRDEGRTILFVTHDMGAVRRFCHRALLIERGEVRMIGDPDAVGEQLPRAELRPRPGRTERGRRGALRRPGGRDRRRVVRGRARAARRRRAPGPAADAAHAHPLPRARQGPGPRVPDRERAAPSAVRHLQRGRQRDHRTARARRRGDLLDLASPTRSRPGASTRRPGSCRRGPPTSSTAARGWPRWWWRPCTAPARWWTCPTT